MREWNWRIYSCEKRKVKKKKTNFNLSIVMLIVDLEQSKANRSRRIRVMNWPAIFKLDPDRSFSLIFVDFSGMVGWSVCNTTFDCASSNSFNSRSLYCWKRIEGFFWLSNVSNDWYSRDFMEMSFIPLKSLMRIFVDNRYKSIYFQFKSTNTQEFEWRIVCYCCC